ncbi:MAG: hypothetical protein KBS52_04895 [Clostridiales bacterium]|nr:hypothetical protein [Candidatus Equinaster intestinalis]
MKNFRFLSAVLSLLLLFTLFAGCSKQADGCYEFSMGKGLPTWEFNEPRQKVLPDSNSDKNLIAIYKTDSTHADVYVYEYEKEGITPESMAKSEAENLGLRVTAIKDKGADAQTYISFEKTDDKSYINQVYFYEGTEKIVKICVKYKTDTLKLADTDYTFCLPSGYTAEVKTDDVFDYYCEYTTKSAYLPPIIIRKFAKDYFSSETYDLSKVTGITEEEYDALAKDGWTLEEELEYYKKTHELDRGEIINRGDKRVTFIGFFDGDMQKARAIIDCGNDFIEICVEQKKDEFKHITSALIDSIVVPESKEALAGG